MSSFGDGEARICFSLQLQEQSRYLDFVGPEFDQVLAHTAASPSTDRAPAAGAIRRISVESGSPVGLPRIGGNVASTGKRRNDNQHDIVASDNEAVTFPGEHPCRKIV